MPSTLRILAPAIIVVAAATSLRAQTVHTGALESSDPVMEDGAWVDEYTIDAAAGQEVVAVVTSVEFDPYVVVTGPSGEQTENDDFGSSREVSLVEAIASESGTWRVQVTSYEAGQSGAYTLALTSRMRTDATVLDEEFTVTGELPAGPTASVSGILDAEDQKRNDVQTPVAVLGIPQEVAERRLSRSQPAGERRGVVRVQRRLPQPVQALAAVPPQARDHALGPLVAARRHLPQEAPEQRRAGHEVRAQEHQRRENDV